MMPTKRLAWNAHLHVDSMNRDNKLPDAMTDPPICPACGVPLSRGHGCEMCPACLLRAAMGADVPDQSASPEAAVAGDRGFPSIAERLGARIGRYRLLEQIGEGGFGVVWMAEQEEPVRRRVALKIIKPGMDTREVVARFEAERQALAMMEHPNIASVFDGGATETGRPYFVMELVKGVPITTYCDAHQLTTRERLELFMEVCHAVQHAHQKGVIHRDLKPSNILVTVKDDRAVPKVIDFGIAKATQARLTENTLFTRLNQWLGTPEYMSPEQAGLGSLDVDTRSDIYSLGVLLYELLTGRPPFDPQELLASGYDAVMRTIREEEPPRPSTRLGTLTEEELTAVAANRGAEPARLNRLVHGDLDWIVMKALEKDRRRRYETANGLARDLENHLNNEPVIARPPGNLYRLQKLVRRNKLAFAAGATITVVLVLAVAVSASQAVIARRAERQAQYERRTAETEAGRADRSAAQEKVQRQRAEMATSEAKTALSTSEFLQACQFIADDKDPAAVAYLVASLRANPANDAAVTRLATLLTYRTWAPLILDLRHPEGVPSTQVGLTDKGGVMASENGPARMADAQTEQPLLELRSAQFSPDGTRFVTTGDDGTARMWDAQTGQPLAAPLKHDGKVWSAQFSPDGKWIVTASEDCTARVWDTQTGQPLTGPLQHAAGCGAQFSPDGKRIVTASADNTARVWDAQTGQPLTEPLQHADGVSSAQFSPDGKRIVTASGDRTARVWDARTGQPLTEPLQHDSGVNIAQFSPDGTCILTASVFMARLWDAQTGQPLTEPLRHDSGVFARFSPDGKWIVTAGDDTARVWDAQTGQPLTEPFKHAGMVYRAEFSQDSKRIVTASWDSTARVWDAQTGQPLTEPLKHADWVIAAQFSPDGKRVLSASRNGTVRMWDVQPRQPRVETLQHAREVRSAQFSPDGKRVVTASANSTARVWDAQTGQPLTGPLHHAGEVRSAQFDPDGKRVVTASDDSTARVWDAQTGQPLTQPLQHGALVKSAQFSPDGKRVVTASDDRTARVWDAQNGQPLTEPLQHGALVNSAQFSPDSKQVVTASEDSTARVWDTQTGQPVTEPLQHAGWVNCAQYSPDGKRVVTASWDATARVWDTQTGQLLTGPLKHANVILSAQFSPDGKRLVTTSFDETARVWDAQTGHPLTKPLRHGHQVICAQFSPDGKRVVTGSYDFTARVWDALTGQPLTEPLKHGWLVFSARFSPDGTRVLTASADGRARMWDVAPALPGHSGWLLDLATAVCGEVLSARGVPEPTNQIQSLDQLRQSLGGQSGDDEWSILGRWLLADPSTRTISPYSKITRADSIE